MKNFDINRFGSVLKWNALMTKKEILTNTASMTFAFVVLAVVQVMSSRNKSDMVVADNFNSFTSFALFVFLIICSIGGCWIFNNMKTKEQRITFKMLPATDLEKFVARALYATIVWWLMAFVAFCLADLFRMLVSLIAGVSITGSAVPLFLSMIFANTNVSINSLNTNDVAFATAIFVMAHAWAFWVHSLYILGGTLFRRRQFVQTTLAHCVIGLVFTPILINFVDTSYAVALREAIISMLWVAAVVFTVWGLVDWWLSYRIFRRMQVINNKWLNV